MMLPWIQAGQACYEREYMEIVQTFSCRLILDASLLGGVVLIPNSIVEKETAR